VIVGGSYNALAFALEAFRDALDPQLAISRTVSGQCIKTIFQPVDIPVSLPPDMFDISL
jgi:hypothetical protein